MFKKIKDFFLKLLAKPLIEESSDLLEAQLRTMATAKPKLFRTLVASVHVAAKEYGTDWVKSTANDLDDLALAEFLDAIEKVAAEFGLDLEHESEALKEA